MTTELQRVTTTYVETEDRLRLSGELAPSQTVVLWLTQRLCNRLLPPLFAWLEGQTIGQASVARAEAHAELLQGFAQQAARAQLPAAPPVEATAPSAIWRVETVDITRAPTAVRLTFKSDAGEAIRLLLTSQALRQWLGIVFDQYVKAEWPTAIWPVWMVDSSPVKAQAAGGRALH